MTSTLDEPVVEIRDGGERYEEQYGIYDAPEPAGRRLPTLPDLSPVPTYVGVAIAVAGFVLIAYAWSKVAGIADNVALQMPYLVSGGLSGLGLVMVGVTIINIAAKRRDARMRQQQTELLADALHELRTALDLGPR
jgi:signal transduction histidine kinase